MPEPITDTGTVDAVDTGKETTEPVAAKETTTPEEVAKVLKGTGMDVKPPVKQAEKGKIDDATETDTTAKETDKSDTDTETAAKETEKPVVKETKAVEKAAAKTVEPAADPNKPDFSFQVEDANGVTFKIQPGDSVEDILKDFEPKNNGQIIAILDQLREAKDKQAKYEADEKTKVSEAEKAGQIKKIQDGWNQEITDLRADKRLPAVDADKANERVDEVYKFMAEENKKRMEAGRPTINSFEDALDKLENKETRDKAVKDAKDAKETARKNGALVGGSSAPASGSTPVYKAGSARNINQAIKAMGLL